MRCFVDGIDDYGRHGHRLGGCHGLLDRICNKNATEAASGHAPVYGEPSDKSGGDRVARQGARHRRTLSPSGDKRMEDRGEEGYPRLWRAWRFHCECEMSSRQQIIGPGLVWRLSRSGRPDRNSPKFETPRHQDTKERKSAWCLLGVFVSWWCKQSRKFCKPFQESMDGFAKSNWVLALVQLQQITVHPPVITTSTTNNPG